VVARERKTLPGAVIKVVYFDEETASDYLDITSGGKQESTSEQVKERTKDTHAKVEAGLIAKLSWIPFLGGSADVSAGAGLSAAGRSILSKTLSNTILTDYLARIGRDKRIRQLRGFRVIAPPHSMAFMKMYTPYMVIMRSEDMPIDLSRIDEALGGAKGYYELVADNGVPELKCILRFNIDAFRNNYGLTDLGRMELVFHGVRVGKATAAGLTMQAEMSQVTGAERLSAADILDETTSTEEALLEVFDVVFAGIEHEE
jgi:Family of unknown function (DUF6414)